VKNTYKWTAYCSRYPHFVSIETSTARFNRSKQNNPNSVHTVYSTPSLSGLWRGGRLSIIADVRYDLLKVYSRSTPQVTWPLHASHIEPQWLHKGLCCEAFFLISNCFIPTKPSWSLNISKIYYCTCGILSVISIIGYCRVCNDEDLVHVSFVRLWQ
jgi:hypothetical protein